MKKHNKKKGGRQGGKAAGLASRLTGAEEFPIGRGVWPGQLVDWLSFITRPADAPKPLPRAETPSPAKNMDRFFAEMATALWRLRQKMVKPGTAEPLDEVRRAFRHLEAAWDLLSQEGVEVKDHTNTPFHLGMMLRVVSYEPTPGISRDQIVETIKPTVFYNGQPIQVGEVIVGTPETAA